MAVPSDLVYPVLLLARDHSITMRSDADQVGRCNALAFYRHHYYENLLIIDAAARQFRVVAAARSPAPSRLRAWLARVTNQRLHVSLTLEPAGEPSLDAAKQRIAEWLDLEPELWEAGDDLAAWKRRVERAADGPSLVRLFA